MKKKLVFNNTYSSGTYTLIALKDGKKFAGVCLEFDLITEGESINDAMEKITEYAEAWLENARKHRIPEEVLNRPAPKKYWDMFKLISVATQKRVKKTKARKAVKIPSLSVFLFTYPAQSPHPSSLQIA